MGKNQPSRRELAMRGFLIIFGIFLSTFALTFINAQVQPQQERERLDRQAKVDELHGSSNPYLVDMTKLFTYHLGKHGITGTASPEAIANGYEVPNRDVNIGGGWPISIKIMNNSLLISANVTDADNQQIGQIQDNVWVGATETILKLYDKNSNNFAFEVVGRDKTVLLQIYFMGLNELDITGFFHSNDGSLIVVTDDIVSMNPSKIEVTPIEQFFLYPSASHPSELVHPERFLPPENSIPLSTWLSYAVWIVGSLGAVISAIVGIDSFWRYGRK